MRYISRLPRVVAADVLDQPRPVVADGATNSRNGDVRACHVVQAVERQHEVVATIGRQFFGADVEQLDVVEPFLLYALRRAIERES